MCSLVFFNKFPACGITMPTNAELAKRIEDLEAKFDSRLTKLVDRIVGDVTTKLRETGFDLGALNSEVKGMNAGLKMLNDIVETVRTQQQELCSTNKALKNENETLKKKVADLEQYTRMNNVEIKGVPSSQGEDCVAIVQSIGNKIDCPVSGTDLDVVHRVPAKSGQQNIVACFYSREQKNEFVRKARKARLNTRALGFSGEGTHAVFVNDHLSPDNKKLFAKALVLKKEKQWAFLWTDNCQIKARKSTDTRVFRIKSEIDLSIIS